MKKLPNIHPGEVLKEEFMVPMDLSAYRVAKDIKIPAIRISEIIRGLRGISTDTALRLAKYFNTTPQFWLGLQNDYDLEEQSYNPDIKSIIPHKNIDSSITILHS